MRYAARQDSVLGAFVYREQITSGSMFTIEQGDVKYMMIPKACLHCAQVKSQDLTNIVLLANGDYASFVRAAIHC